MTWVLSVRALRQVVAKGEQQTCPPIHRAAKFEALESRRLFSAGVEALSITTYTAVATTTTPALSQPKVRTVDPAPDAVKVPTGGFVSAELIIPNGGIDKSSLTSSNVYLYRVSNKAMVPAVVNTSGGGDVIVLKPKSALAPYALYRFVVTSGVRDVAGVRIAPFSSYFTTGAATLPPTTSPIRFEKLGQSNTVGRNYFGMAVGPDGRLYAGSDDGRIYRFNIAANGSLGVGTAIDTIRRYNGGARFIVGMTFDPKSTAANPILWVTHTATSSLVLGGTAGADLTGKVSVLSGSSLGTYRDAVINLPRSVRDHVTAQPIFGPDGALYFCQSSMSSMGKADVIWGNRPERLLSAAILRLDVPALGNGTVNALTPDAGGTYNPSAAGAKLTVYADGVRNAFDLVWHRNGQLYAAANGGAAGGNTPVGPAGSGIPSLMGVSKPETDFLFRIVKGGYYGHPNPKRGHYVLNGGNPTAGKDPFEVTDYPVGLKPDPAWRPAVYDFGIHQAPSGSLEYKSPAFGGALNGRLLVSRYSGGDDILVLTLNSSGGVAKAESGFAGLTGLADPVDLIQAPNSGNLYVIEMAKKRITLLRVDAPLATTASANIGQESPPSLVDAPPARTDPDTADVPTSPSRSEQRRLDLISALCSRMGSGSPSVEMLRGKGLTSAFKTIKQLRTTAAAKGTLIPDLTGKSLFDLRELLRNVKALGNAKL